MKPPRSQRQKVTASQKAFQLLTFPVCLRKVSHSISLQRNWCCKFYTSPFLWMVSLLLVGFLVSELLPSPNWLQTVSLIVVLESPNIRIYSDVCHCLRTVSICLWASLFPSMATAIKSKVCFLFHFLHSTEPQKQPTLFFRHCSKRHITLTTGKIHPQRFHH